MNQEKERKMNQEKMVQIQQSTKGYDLTDMSTIESVVNSAKMMLQASMNEQYSILLKRGEKFPDGFIIILQGVEQHLFNVKYGLESFDIDVTRLEVKALLRIMYEEISK